MSERFRTDADIEMGPERKEPLVLGHTQEIARVLAAELLANLDIVPVPVRKGEGNE